MIFQYFFTIFGIYVYDSNKNEIIEINDVEYKELQDYAKGTIKDIISPRIKAYADDGFFKKSNVENIIHPYTGILKYLLERKMNYIILQLTQNCNLRCNYCVYSEKIENNNRCHSNKRMNIATGKKAIDYLFMHSVDSTEVTIGFYGGEPLLEFQNLKELVAYAKAVFIDKSVKFTITTNGTLLSEEVSKFLYENDFGILISLDGPKDIHDLNRRFYSGEGSYDMLMNNLLAIKRLMPDFFETIKYSMVVDPDNDFDEINKIVNSDVGININLIFSAFVERPENDHYSFSSDFVEKYQYNKFLAMLAFFNKVSEKLRSPLLNQDIGTMVNDYDTMAIRGGIGRNDAPSGPCATGQHRPMIDVEGNIYPCERVCETSEMMRIGNIFDGIDVAKATKLLNVAQITEDSCKQCWCFKFCTSCPKYADAGTYLSEAKRRKKCAEIQQSAYERVQQIIMLNELDKYYNI